MHRIPTLVAGAVAMIGLGGGEAVAASSTTRLPTGFLLYEARAGGPSHSWEHWKISDRLNRRLEVNPCDRDPGGKNRTAIRTITYISETDYLSEQVVVYNDEASARKAMSSVHADLKRCAHGGKGFTRYSYRWKNVGIGDGGLRVGGFFYESRVRYVVARKGKAVVIYGRTGNVTGSLPSSQFRSLLKDARTMAGKICEVPHVCE